MLSVFSAFHPQPKTRTWWTWKLGSWTGRLSGIPVGKDRQLGSATRPTLFERVCSILNARPLNQLRSHCIMLLQRTNDALNTRELAKESKLLSFHSGTLSCAWSVYILSDRILSFSLQPTLSFSIHDLYILFFLSSLHLLVSSPSYKLLSWLWVVDMKPAIRV